MQGWRPVYGHPDGPAEQAWFFVTAEGLAFPTDHHPAGWSRSEPWFVVDEPLVFRGAGHPDGAAPDPDYRIIGSFLYLIEHGPAGEGGPWYQIVRPS